MYQYTLYNDNCVINTKSNTIIFDGDAGWSEFELWKKSNKELHDNLLKEKNNKLLWNCGYPHIKNYDKYFYNSDGDLYKIVRDKSVEHISNGTPYQIDLIEDGRIIYMTKYTPTGLTFETHDFELKEKRYYGIETGEKLRYERERKCWRYVVEYYANGTPRAEVVYRTSLYLENTLMKELTYFPSAELKSFLKFTDGKYVYKEYYHKNGKLNSRGYLTKNNNMEGDWEFYYENGNLKSKHNLSEGQFRDTSYLYYENGNLIGKIIHD